VTTDLRFLGFVSKSWLPLLPWLRILPRGWFTTSAVHDFQAHPRQLGEALSELSERLAKGVEVVRLPAGQPLVPPPHHPVQLGGGQQTSHLRHSSHSLHSLLRHSFNFLLEIIVDGNDEVILEVRLLFKGTDRGGGGAGLLHERAFARSVLLPDFVGSGYSEVTAL